MTEREAWLKLARNFRSDVWNREIPADGVCDAVVCLRGTSEKVFNSMLLKLDKERRRRRKGEFQYWWAMKEGPDEARSRFCEQMARRCK